VFGIDLSLIFNQAPLKIKVGSEKNKIDGCAAVTSSIFSSEATLLFSDNPWSGYRTPERHQCSSLYGSLSCHFQGVASHNSDLLYRLVTLVARFLTEADQKK
jgi:hypothetical protein